MPGPEPELLRADLVRDEGTVLHAYRDSRGYLTIGHGRLIDPRLGGGISRAEAGLLLERDIAGALAGLDGALPWWRQLPEPAARGLANMAFNLGLGRLLGFGRMLAALEAGDFPAAAAEALDSAWARQVGARARRIAALYRDCA